MLGYKRILREINKYTYFVVHFGKDSNGNPLRIILIFIALRFIHLFVTNKLGNSNAFTNVVVCFPARNEEEFLPRVLDALEKQSLKPLKVIIADDGSTDQTYEIARAYSFVEVNKRTKRDFDVVGKIEMGDVWNSSIIPTKKIHEKEKIDYVLFLGGDMVLPKNYIMDIVAKFEENPKLMIAAGTMIGDKAYKSTGFMIPGPGRVIRYSYWEKLGGKYPEKQGWEAFPVYMANMEGFTTQIFPDIEYRPLRVTGGRTDYYSYGLAMKAFGYFFLFALGRSLKQLFMKGRGVKAAINMFRGYLFGKSDNYSDELRNYINRTQRKRIRKLIFRF